MATFYKYLRDLAWNGEYLVVDNFGWTTVQSRDIVTYREGGCGDYQMLYIHRGYGIFCLNGKTTRLNSGSVVLIYPGEKNDYTFPKKSATEYYWIHFSGVGAADLLAALKLGSGTYNVGEYSAFISAMDKMAHSSAADDFTTDAFLSGTLMALLSAISKRIYVTDSPFSKVIEQMQKDGFGKMQNTDYARMCGMTEYHFIRQFKKATGLTPLRYKTKLLVNRAMEIMAMTDLNISEIAYALGFEDSLYFSRLFKKEIGISPKNYMANQIKRKP